MVGNSKYKHNALWNNSSLGEVFGCEWSSWGEWSECTKSCGGGNVMRMREKLPGIGSCDGAKEEITVCDNEVKF